MKRFTQILAERRADKRPALPVILKALDDADMRLYRSQTVLIVGQPGSGKSMLSLFLATRLAMQGVRVLYISSDTDEQTQSMRAAAISGGMTVKDAYESLDTEREAKLEEAFMRFESNLVIDETSDPTLDDIEAEILAVNEAWGAPPEVIVVDVLANVSMDDEEWAGARAATQYFHSLARKTGACIMICHHVSEARSKPDWPAPLGAVQGRVNAMPEQVWSVALVEEDFKVAAVKNRHGRANKKAENAFSLGCEPERMTLYDSEAAKAQAKKSREWQ